MKKANFYTEDPKGFATALTRWSKNFYPKRIKHRDRKRAHRRGQCWKQNKCKPFFIRAYRNSLQLSRFNTIKFNDAANSLANALNGLNIATEECAIILNAFAERG